MSYNWKCCSFYPNNFDASALKEALLSSYPDRGTHVLRPRYACIPTEVRMNPDRGTHTPRPKRDNFQKYLTLYTFLNKQILL